MLQLVPQAVAQDAGPFTFPGARVVGVGDITQFIVEAAPTQTNNLVEIQANGGAFLAAFGPTGFLGIGAAPLTDRILRTDYVFNSAAAVYGATIQVQNQGNGVVRGAGYTAIATSASTPSDVFGIEAIARTLSTSSPTRMAAGSFRGQMDSTGTVASIRTVWIKAPSKHASATITILYGLYIDALTQGGTDYSIYTQGGTISHGDDLEFRQASTISTAAGDLTISPAAQVYFTTFVGVGRQDPKAQVDIFVNSAGFDATDHLSLSNQADTIDNAYAGIVFATRTSAGQVGKSWFGVEQTANFGRGDFIWLLDAVADDNTVALADEVMRLTNAGWWGLGTVPQVFAHIKEGASGATPNVASTLVLEDSGTNYLSFLSADDSLQAILFGDASDNDRGGIFYEHDGDYFFFRANANSEALVVEDTSIGIGLIPTANMAGLSIEAGVVTIKETTTPTADADYGKVYTKADNKMYFQDGAGTEHEIAFV